MKKYNKTINLIYYLPPSPDHYLTPPQPGEGESRGGEGQGGGNRLLRLQQVTPLASSSPQLCSLLFDLYSLLLAFFVLFFIKNCHPRPQHYPLHHPHHPHPHAPPPQTGQAEEANLGNQRAETCQQELESRPEDLMCVNRSSPDARRICAVFTVNR